MPRAGRASGSGRAGEPPPSLARLPPSLPHVYTPRPRTHHRSLPPPPPHSITHISHRYAYPITCTGFTKGPDGSVVEVQATCERELGGRKPPKGVLNWVGQPSPGSEPPRFEARLYDVLFSSSNPAALEEWLEDLNPASLEVVRGAYATPALAAAPPGERFQLERLGYFCVDPDTATAGQLVLNRTCTLRESFPKQTAAAAGSGGGKK